MAIHQWGSSETPTRSADPLSGPSYTPGSIKESQNRAQSLSFVQPTNQISLEPQAQPSGPERAVTEMWRVIPGSPALGFGCVPQSIIINRTFTDSHVPIKLFSHTSFSPICVPSTAVAGTKRATITDLHLTHLPLALCCTTF